MKLAVPFENGQVFPHFDQAEQFKIYTVSEDEILSEELLSFEQEGGADRQSSRVSLLAGQGVSVLICGSIGVGSVIASQEARIQILGGASGEAEARILDFLGGTLHFGAQGGCASCGISCSHHADGNDEAECDGNISACGHWCH